MTKSRYEIAVTDTVDIHSAMLLAYVSTKSAAFSIANTWARKTEADIGCPFEVHVWDLMAHKYARHHWKVA